MPLVTKTQIDFANHVDLAQFLISRGEKLKRVSGEYIWESQNVWIRENKWFSHYEQKGGYPVEFVMKFFGLTFTDAVCELIGEHKSGYCADNPEKSANDYSGSHLLPKSNKNTYRIYQYLKNKRGIAPEIINAFAKMGLIYEDKEHHSCVFVGRDENNRPGHCHVRSTITYFRQTIRDSKAEYAFHYNGTGDTIFAFEAPIDMLAYISMHMERWRENSYVALCSVSEKALMHQLETHPKLRRIVLCLDSDEAGQSAATRIKKSLLEKGYTDVQVDIPLNKDWDEDLQVLRGIRPGIKPHEDNSWTGSQSLSLSLS